jgi:hypothetical protein
MATARDRDKVPLDLLPDAVDITHLRHRMFDSGSLIPPPPLEDTSGDAPEVIDLAAIRAQGGPQFAALRSQIAAAVASGDHDSLGDLFNSLPHDLRRPVEILGLLHLLTDTHHSENPSVDIEAGHDNGVEVASIGEDTPPDRLDALRPDGSRRTFLLPRLPLPAATVPSRPVTPESLR